MRAGSTAAMWTGIAFKVRLTFDVEFLCVADRQITLRGIGNVENRIAHAGRLENARADILVVALT